MPPRLPLIPVETMDWSVKPIAGLWQEAQETVLFEERIGSK